MPGHQLALAHEGPRIAAAINRYFGYVLVDQIRPRGNAVHPRFKQEGRGLSRPPIRLQLAAIGRVVDGIADERLAARALTQLGLGIAKQRR